MVLAVIQGLGLLVSIESLCSLQELRLRGGGLVCHHNTEVILLLLLMRLLCNT